MSIVLFLEPGAFDSEATQAMGEAFDAACKQLDDRGQPLTVRGVMARRIIEAANCGERDPIILRDRALAGFGITRRQG